uniref:Evasin n=1 Tax=Rhipicephalus zambeziensis TaxID=60191 RepID=A0A224Y3D7_9ACAR
MKTVFFLTLAFISATFADNGNTSTVASFEATKIVKTEVTKPRMNRNVTYGLHIDTDGCVYKVVESMNALFTVSCHTWCLHGQFYRLPNFMPCLQVANDFAERSLERSRPSQCIQGVCINGECRTSYRRVSCRVPKARMHCWDTYGNYHVMRR